MILTCVVTTALLLSLCGAAPLGDGLEVLVDSSVSVLAGHSATLPCWLNPPQSALDFEVQWYHGDHQDSSVMVYKDNKIQNDARNTTFDGRVSFGKKEAASGGLASGDVSLKLLNVTLGDAGKYTCYVSGDQDYDKATVTLTVSKTGGPVRLSAVWRGNHTVNVSCESGGWHPEPRLQWRDSRGNVLTPETPLKHSRDPSGLVSVHSWLLVSSSSEVSCSVGLDGGEAKEASVRMDGLNLPGGKNAESLSDSGPSVAGWVAFALLLIAVLAALGVLLFRRRAVPKNRQPTEENTSGEADLPLLPEKQTDLMDKKKSYVKPTDHNDTKKSFVNVTFANTGNRYLTVGVDRCTMRDSQEAKSLTEVTCLTVTTGTTGFSSGQHYWEVSMKMENVDVKRSWWLGVTRALQSDAVPTASNGFWFLSSSSDHFHFSTEPQVLLPVPCRPETVGVYLDCDTGELSFYNVEEKSLIGSLTVAAGHELYPLFNPGLGDQSSMRLIRETIKEPDTNNSGV